MTQLLELLLDVIYFEFERVFATMGDYILRALLLECF